MEFKNQSVKFKTGEQNGLKDGEFLVYPATFIRKPDAYGDVVAKGAFLDSIKAWKESGNVLSGYYGHRMDDPDFNIAYALDMGEDDHGWWVKGAFDMDSPKARQTYRLVKSGRLNQLSFAYDVMDAGPVEIDGVKAFELRKLNVHEFSFVPVGANQDTTVEAIKSVSAVLETEVKAGRVLAQKHIDSLRNAHEAIGVVLNAAEVQNEEQTSGSDAAKSAPADEEPAVQVKSAAADDEQVNGPSVADLDLMIALRRIA